jgi:2,3-bisphosphoglycerate-independent phosphoglycerate mutase
MARPKPVLLLILDGWGHRDDAAHNAIAKANAPNWRRLLAEYPHTLVDTFGEHVGLPHGQMGNSEVGHMNIGSGRIVYQDLTRIDAGIADGTFFENAALAGACDAAKRTGGTLHVLGLASPGGVHSHEDHILAMLDLAARRGVTRIAVHAFLDGRDTPPRSARATLEKFEAKCASIPGARVASVSGRYFAMDRDKRWDRVQLAYDAVANAESPLHAASAVEALELAYARGENDEFVKPTVVGDGAKVVDGDAVVFMNFRADRAREMSHAFVDANFDGFRRARKIELSAFVSLTDYEKGLAVSAIAYPAQSMQLRIAETEKYAHVTFFFSGGREAPFDREERILVPSPHVATYDLKPEMSCPEVTDRLVEAIASRKFDFIVCNIANADMVGHTGIEAAAIKAVEAVDVALGRLTDAIVAAGGEMLISADHGNLEQMIDANGVAHTQHTVGPVPLVYVGRRATLHHGALRDLAPTVLALMALPQPPEMTGHSLVEFAA